jgi:hypothetical protein
MHARFIAFSILLFTPFLTAQQNAPTPAVAPAAPAVAPVATPPQPHTLVDGTPIKLRLGQTLSSADAKVGQEVPFEVMEEISVDNVVVLPKGSTAIASVTEADHKKSMGRAGKLNVSINYARLSDQEKIALRAVKDAKGGSHTGAMTGAIVATSIVFFPAAPLFLFIHGKDITIPQGTEITAFIDGDMHLDMARFGAHAAPGAANTATSSSTQSNIAIESTPPGADIEVDGAFVGNTPSTIAVAPGNHQIAIKKKGFAEWTRKLNVTGGSIHLNAELEAAAAGAAQ